MKKFLGILFVFLVLIVVIGFGIWKGLKIENVIDDLYVVNGKSIYLINKNNLTFTNLYNNPEYSFLNGKLLKVSNIPAVFPEEIYTNEKNIITAWVSKTDNTKVILVEINPRLQMTKTYNINLNLGPDLRILNPVYDLRLARGGGDGSFGLGCEYGNYQSCVWVIPRVEPLKGPNDYSVNGIKVSYMDTIAYPVVERFSDKVEYKHMYETLYSDQPEFTPGE